MPGEARVQDITIGVCDHGQPCCPHDCVGQIEVGSPDTSVEGRGNARQYDIGTHNCPHCGANMMLKGSSTVTTNGIGDHRCNDDVDEMCGMGITSTCSSTVISG